LYLAYTAPHWPLHAWPEDVRKYEDLYQKGWDELRQARYQRMLKMGIVQERWGLSPSDAPAWQTFADKDELAHRMAVYAAQVDRMDQGVGKVLDKLKQMGAMDNTLILFLSDNGGCAEVVERSKGVPAGGPDSFLSYTKSWANMSNTPFRRYKSQVHEGGIATPLVAHWPAGIAAAGSFNHEAVHEMDIMPTCLELAGAEYPKIFHDKPILPLEGQSLAPIFRGQPFQQHQTMFWEHEGDRAARVGKWKLVAYRETGPWELYDIEADRTELSDLAEKMPEKVKEMSAMYEKWATRVGVVPFSKLPRKVLSAGATSRPAAGGAATWPVTKERSAS
jgi:arylsulfatase